jgi:hypothetical protein
MLFDSVSPIDNDSQNGKTEATKYKATIKNLEWENRKLKEELLRKESELAGLQLKISIQTQATEGLFQELEKTF